MKKKIISLLLSFVMVMSLALPVHAAEEWNGDCFTYDGTTITGLSDEGAALLETNTEVVLPATNPEGVAITAIGVSAFASKGITAVTIPETVTTIGQTAFNGNKLEEVVLPDSVTSLGLGAFTNNVTLTKVTLSKNLTVIPQSAFQGARITELVIPEGVTEVGRTAFSDSRLTSLSLPSTLVTVGRDAFKGNQLTSLVIPDSVVTIDQGGFSQSLSGLTPSLKEVTFGSGLKTIGQYAFRDTALTEVTMPAGVETIHKNAFKNTLAPVKVYTANEAHLALDASADSHYFVLYAPFEGSIELKKDQLVYDGNAAEPKVVSVKDGAGNVIAAEDYEVIYDADSANVGKHNVTVKITSDGKYVGEMTTEYVVVPAEVKGLKGFRYQVGNRVKLEWKESTGATGYKIQYKSAKYSKTYTKYVSRLSDVKNKLACSKTYTFKVTPYYRDANGVRYMASSETNSVKVTTAKAISKKVGQVSSVTVKKSSSKKVKVSWKNVSNETGYQISRSSKADGTNIVKTIKSTSAKSTTVSGGTKGTTYYYKVRAYRTVGTKKVYSDWSEPIAFTLE